MKWCSGPGNRGAGGLQVRFHPEEQKACVVSIPPKLSSCLSNRLFSTKTWAGYGIFPQQFFLLSTNPTSSANGSTLGRGDGTSLGREGLLPLHPRNWQQRVRAWDQVKRSRSRPGERATSSSGAGPGSWASSRSELMLALAQPLGERNQMPAGVLP